MSLFLSIQQKKTSEVELVRFLGQQLSTFYGSSSENARQDLEALNKLRKEATYKGIDGKSTATLTALQKYYDQLKSFNEKCPITDVPINFKWKDSFEKESAALSFLTGSSSQIIQSLAYEKICILFNIGASYSEIAANLVNEDFNNEHALKIATKNFQSSAGIFLALKSEVPASLGQRCNHPDLDPNILNILHFIMLAQAQEAICIKATSSMSDINISKVASQCADYYGEAHKLIQVVKNIWPATEWINHILAKQLVYIAISDFHQAAIAKAAKKYGEEISWLKHSVECFQQAEAKETQSEFTQNYAKKATRRCEEAIKENDFIYHARVPEYSSLSVIERFSLVKPLPPPTKFLPESNDLFSDLVPPKVQHKPEPKRPDIGTSELASLSEATKNLNEILSSLNLPASNEDGSGVDLPQSLKDKSKYVKEKGGYNHVNKLISELPHLLQRNLEILSVIERSISDEERQDYTQREKYGKSKWTRAPSDILNKAWKDYVQKYKDLIKNAQVADDKVKDKFKNHESEIRLLSSDDLNAIRDASSSSTVKDQFFNRLAVAYDAFNDLLNHLGEGTKFYNDLTEILVNIQAKVDDFCLSRKIEHDELIRSLGDIPPNASSETRKPSSSSSTAPPTAPGQPPQQPGGYYSPMPPLPTMPYSYGAYGPDLK